MSLDKVNMNYLHFEDNLTLQIGIEPTYAIEEIPKLEVGVMNYIIWALGILSFTSLAQAVSKDLIVGYRLVELRLASGNEDSCHDFSKCPEASVRIELDKSEIPHSERVILTTHVLPEDCFSPFPTIRDVKLLDETKTSSKMLRLFSEVRYGVGSTCEGLFARKIDVKLPPSYDDITFVWLKQSSEEEEPLMTLISYETVLEGECRYDTKTKDNCRYSVKNLKVTPNLRIMQE